MSYEGVPLPNVVPVHAGLPHVDGLPPQGAGYYYGCIVHHELRDAQRERLAALDPGACAECRTLGHAPNELDQDGRCAACRP